MLTISEKSRKRHGGVRVICKTDSTLLGTQFNNEVTTCMLCRQLDNERSKHAYLFLRVAMFVKLAASLVKMVPSEVERKDNGVITNYELK